MGSDQSIFKRIATATKIASMVLKSNTFTNTDRVEEYLSTISDVSSLVCGKGVEYQTNCYNLCPPLQSIIGKKAQSLINGKLICVDSNEQAIKNSSFDKAMKILDRPNIYQTRSEFFRTMETFMSVYGVCYVYKIDSIGFGLTGLVCIPNNAISITYRTGVDILGNNDDIVLNYSITLYGRNIILDGDFVNRIIQVKDNTVNLLKGYELRPYSKIDGLKYPISNIVASLESRNQIIVKRGADVILSPDAGVDKGVSMSALSPTERKKIQEEYARYGSLKTQWSTLITTIPMKAQQITRKIQDLGLFEGEDFDIRAILRAYNTPTPIFGLKDEAKYNTYAEAKREYIEDGIVPDAKIICEALDKIFDATKNGYSFYLDYSHLSCMQQSEKAEAEALKTEVEALKIAIESGLMDINEAKDKLKDYLS